MSDKQTWTREEVEHLLDLLGALVRSIRETAEADQRRLLERGVESRNDWALGSVRGRIVGLSFAEDEILEVRRNL